MQIDEASLTQIAINVCQLKLGLELSSITGEVDIARQLVASVEIRGDRHSVVEVFAHDHLMASIAEAMFRSSRDNLSEEEVQDAFCEIANMIAGSVKSFVGETADLSLPVIGPAHHWLHRAHQGSLRTTFECCGCPLTIVLREVVAKPKAVERVAVDLFNDTWGLF